MIVAIIQARMNSSRLSGKVLRPLAGVAILKHVYDRVSYSKYIDKVIVATSVGESDNMIEAFCSDNGIECYRGSEDDVLDRFYHCSQSLALQLSDTLVRITADCPLIDSDVIDNIIDKHFEMAADYTSNTLVPTYPDGLDAEVFSFRVLENAWQRAALPSEREHVTPYIKKNGGLFKVQNVLNDVDYSELRWTVDEVLDYQLLNVIYDKLFADKPDFKMSDVLELVEANPGLRTMNKKFARDEGYQRSLQLDAEYNIESGERID